MNHYIILLAALVALVCVVSADVKPLNLDLSQPELKAIQPEVEGMLLKQFCMTTEPLTTLSLTLQRICVVIFFNHLSLSLFHISFRSI